jgi:hypothetical protein
MNALGFDARRAALVMLARVGLAGGAVPWRSATSVSFSQCAAAVAPSCRQFERAIQYGVVDSKGALVARKILNS